MLQVQMTLRLMGWNWKVAEFEPATTKLIKALVALDEDELERYCKDGPPLLPLGLISAVRGGQVCEALQPTCCMMQAVGFFKLVSVHPRVWTWSGRQIVVHTLN